MKRIIAVGMAGVLAAAVAGPRPVMAGEREWATAGKILTGVVVAGMLHHAVVSPPVCVRSEVTVTRPVYERRLVTTACRPQPTRRVVVRPAPRVLVERQFVVRTPPPPPPRTDPIVVYQGNGQRLYQPPVHGHMAFVQVYSEVSGEWVSIREHPSLW